MRGVTRAILALPLVFRSLIPAQLTVCPDWSPWARRIAKMEGFYAKTGIPVTHNNPGSLLFAGQPAATPGTRGFARFPTRDLGMAALERDLFHKGYNLSRMQRAWTWIK